MFVHIAFKYGLIGLGILCYLWFRPVRALLRIADRYRNGAVFPDGALGHYGPAIAFVYIAFLPTGFLSFGWTAKTAFISTLMMMIAYHTVRLETSSGS